MNKIQILDEATINRIAAGEVIDRPASVVKELVENSLDAQATEIIVTIESGGKKLIKITDNGQGISKDDLALAIKQHATSKISAFDDIYQIPTMGFRGEALASICHVAHVRILSKTKADSAYEIEVLEGQVRGPELSSHTTGTTIEVHSIFHTVPVRLKYLKSNATEFSYIYEVVQQFSLIYPQVNFRLISEGKEVLNTTGITDLLTLLCMFWGKKLKTEFIKIDSQAGDIYFQGYLSKPTTTYSNRARQIIAVNNRIIKSSLIQKLLLTVYQDLIPGRRYPMLVLNMQIPFNLLDINIHPQKQEVKFLSSNYIYDSLYKAIKANMLQTEELIYAKTPAIMPENGILHSVTAKPETVAVHQFTQNQTANNNWLPLFASQQVPAEKEVANFEFFQVFKTYLVINSTDGIWIMDQHAAHERILYEQIKKNTQQKQEAQKLLISEFIDLAPDQYALFEEEKSVFNALNFDIETFGSSQIVVRQVPLEFTDVSLTKLLPDLLDQIKEAEIKSENIDIKFSKYQMMACKAAIKAGKAMTEPEVRQLIKDFFKTPDNFTCPHGRPLVVKFGKKDLEKLFKRI